MKWWLRLFALAAMIVPLAADDKSVDFDPDTDFSKYKTFAIRAEVITARSPALNNSIVKERITSAIRKELVADGLQPDATEPDLVVNFRLGASADRDVETIRTGRLGRRRTRVVVDRDVEGTLVIDLLERESRDLVWRGIYTDEENDAARISRKLDDDVRKLFEDYPPKKND